MLSKSKFVSNFRCFDCKESKETEKEKVGMNKEGMKMEKMIKFE